MLSRNCLNHLFGSTTLVFCLVIRALLIHRLSILAILFVVVYFVDLQLLCFFYSEYIWHHLASRNMCLCAKCVCIFAMSLQLNERLLFRNLIVDYLVPIYVVTLIVFIKVYVGERLYKKFKVYIRIDFLRPDIKLMFYGCSTNVIYDHK